MTGCVCVSCEADDPQNCIACETCGNPWCDWLGQHPEPAVPPTAQVAGEPEPPPATTNFHVGLPFGDGKYPN